MQQMARCPSCFEQKKEPYQCDCGYQSKQKRECIYLPIGSFLHAKDYVIGKVLGKPGGFGITYLAWDTRFEIKVAIKEYLPFQIAARASDGISILTHAQDYQTDFDTGLEKFLLEAKMLARFRHPNIVSIINFFQENNTAYLVMEYLEGASLAEYLAKVGTLTVSDAVEIFLPVLNGLSHIHSENVLHRDIKPSNIYLTNTGQAILLDFGSSRHSLGERSQNLTAIVSSGFAPWEQYHRKGQGPWTDVYACAATLYFMLTGKVPPDGTERLVDDDIVPLQDLMAESDQKVSAVVMQSLDVNPEKRHQTAEDFAKQLLIAAKTKPVLMELPIVPTPVPEQISPDDLIRATDKFHNPNTVLKYFGEDDDFIKGECCSCKRVLKIPWQSVWFSGALLEVNDSKGIACPCGLIHKKIEGVSTGRILKAVYISIGAEKKAEEYTWPWPFSILGPRTSFTPNHRWGDTIVQWIKSPCEGIVQFVWTDKEKPIKKSVASIVVFDTPNKENLQIMMDVEVWVKSIKVSKGDRVVKGQELLEVATNKPLKDGELRWFFSKPTQE